MREALAPLMSSAKDDWETPDDLFERWNNKYNFSVDVCANGINHKCDDWYGPGGLFPDGLEVEWGDGALWMNPPYGKEIAKWVKQADYYGSRGETVVVALLPARTDTRWFHDHIYGYHKIHFLKGRLKFKGAKHSAPFPSMIVVFGERP